MSGGQYAETHLSVVASEHRDEAEEVAVLRAAPLDIRGWLVGALGSTPPAIVCGA